MSRASRIATTRMESIIPIGKTDEVLYEGGCVICPLRNNRELLPMGSCSKSGVYILTNHPTNGAFFSENALQRISDSALRGVEYRVNAIVRSSVSSGQKVLPDAVKCCRKSVEDDIVAHRPRVIFAMGGAATHWLGVSGFDGWRGRPFMGRVRDHVCWVVPVNHPEDLKRVRTSTPGSWEYLFRVHVRKGLKLVCTPPLQPVANMPPEQVKCYTGDTDDDFDKVCEKLREIARNRRDIAFDYETISDEPLVGTAKKKFRKMRPFGKGAKIVSIAVSDVDDAAFAFAYEHPAAGWTKSQMATLRELWRDVLKSDCKKCVHNISFEGEWTAYHFGFDSIDNVESWHDTYSMSYVMSSRTISSNGASSLKNLTIAYCGIDAKENSIDVSDLRNVRLQKILMYNGRDAWATRHLYKRMWDVVNREPVLRDVYYDQIDREFSVIYMQQLGVKVDMSVNKSLYDKNMESKTAAIKKLLTMDAVKKFNLRHRTIFNPASNDHVREYFNETYGTQLTDAQMETLTSLNFSEVPLIRSFRKAVKNIGTYIEPFGRKDQLLWDGDVIRPMFSASGAETRRYSCANPNGQNLPKREALYVREQFIPPLKDHVFVAVDYGQQEARVFAMASQDKNLKRRIIDGADVHSEWRDRIAAAVPSWIKSYNGDMKKARNDVKGYWTFALMYGAGDKTIARYLRISERELAPVIAQYKKEFCGVFEWSRRMQKMYEEHGYVELLTGFRRRGPLNFSDRINSPIQGSGAEITAKAIHNCCGAAMVPLLTVHDELVFCVHRDKIDGSVETIVREMLRPAVQYHWATVPLTVEVSVGKNLAELSPHGEYDSREIFGVTSAVDYKGG